MKGKVLTAAVLFMAILLVFAGCNPNGDGDGEEWTAQSLYPLKENVRYEFEGEGSEYAAFYTVADYLEGNKIQRRTDNGGTQSVEVIQVESGVVEQLFQQEEAYYRENMLEKTNGSEVLIMDPIEVGTQWDLSNGAIRSITGVGVEITTPAGVFNTVEVTTEYDAEGTGVLKEYYAKDVGLVKEVYATEEDEITSTLAQIVEDESWSQSVIFYYPSQEYEVYDYIVKEVSYETNQITRTILEEEYKEDAPYPVLTEGTQINWLYLNQDGMVYVDVSKEFIDEMNAGAGFEAMTLQALANTVGGYYGVDRVLLTVDGQLYESGHIALLEGEYLEVNLENVQPYQADSGNGNGNGHEWTAESLYPLIGDVHYVYEGYGNEYAAYDAVIDYQEGNKIQWRTNNGGTESVEVVQVESGAVERLYQMGEIYYRENMLKKSNTNEILIQDPIEVGNQWSVPNDGTRTITGVGVQVSTPLGTFETVEITVEYDMEGVGVTKEYYGEGVGLVKEAYVFSADPSGEEEITSTLAQIDEEYRWVQHITFYYPSQEYEVYDYVVKDVSFATNQITRKTLEAMYKEEAPYPVLTDGTLINWLYLNQDGMAYIDVSKEFVQEMNAGAGFEAMTLQALANTVGSYYGVERVYLTVENQLYEGGHIALLQGEYLEVNLENTRPYEN